MSGEKIRTKRRISQPSAPSCYYTPFERQFYNFSSAFILLFLQVLEYINKHLSQDIKLADLAQLLGMSQFHFSHLFKQAIGTAPYQYLIQQRVERAKQLLRAITDIAFQCGFNSHSHLSKQFRQFTGMTPRAYRAN